MAWTHHRYPSLFGFFARWSVQEASMGWSMSNEARTSGGQNKDNGAFGPLGCSWASIPLNNKDRLKIRWCKCYGFKQSWRSKPEFLPGNELCPPTIRHLEASTRALKQSYLRTWVIICWIFVESGQIPLNCCSCCPPKMDTCWNEYNVSGLQQMEKKGKTW